MEELNFEDLKNEMIKAASLNLGDMWKYISDDLTGGFQKILEEIKNIYKWKAENKITEERAKDHIEIQKKALISLILSKKGIEIIKIEKAINAALDAIKNPVNKAMGWILI